MEINVAIVGDMLVGKTSLITKFANNNYEIKYSDGKYADHFIEIITQKETVKSFKLSNNEGNVTLKIFEANDIPSLLKVSVPNIVIFTFDLSNMQSLISLRESYRQLRCDCRYCDVILVGTKYDFYNKLSSKQHVFINKEVSKFAKAMNSIVFYVSIKKSNMDQLFQYVLNRVFNLHSDRNRKQMNVPIILS